MVEGQEVKRYKNIDLPDMLKEVEMLDFHFNVPENGKVTFEINYAQGVLPEVLKINVFQIHLRTFGIHQIST